MPSIKITYFDAPGRAESSRIMLALGDIEFEDKRVSREEWMALKPSTPQGQLPILEVDGKVLAQSTAIEWYCASLVPGMIPSDPWLTAKMNEALSTLKDAMDPLMATFAIQDPDAKIAKRKELLAGAINDKMKLVEKLLSAAGGPFLLGADMCYADIALFSSFSMLISGMLDGVPKDLLNEYPVIKAHHNKVAEVPTIAKRYGDDRATFKVLP